MHFWQTHLMSPLPDSTLGSKPPQFRVLSTSFKNSLSDLHIKIGLQIISTIEYD
jgi:hypothetical protein